MSAEAVRRAAGLSSKGRVRKNNEDSAYLGRFLYAVADGLGGHVGGQVASATVIEALRSCDVQIPPADLTETIGRAIEAANDKLRREVEQRPELHGMGTTLTAMLWSGDRYVVAHIGDSRAYLLREGRLMPITEDHTLGNLVSSAGKSVYLSSLIARYLDGRPERSSDLTIREARRGDRYLICSDGLTAVVPYPVLRDVLASQDAPAQIAGRLVELANEGGGPDNITVVIIDVAASDADAELAGPATLGAAAG